MKNILIPENNNGISVLTYIPNFFQPEEAQRIRKELDSINDWKTGYSDAGNKIQRRQKWYQTDNQTFCKRWTKKHERWESHQYSSFLLELQNKLEKEIKSHLVEHQLVQIPKFNSLLINYYEDGNNFIPPHQDNKYSFGEQPTIALLSFGETRKFILERTHYNVCKRNKEENHLNQSFDLNDNSLFIMSGNVQQYFCHSIEKEEDKINPRYSLTFRQYID